MLTAVFGLIGVIVGGLITAGASYILEERRANREEALARNKLRLHLFDRRYKIYEATQAFLRVGVKDNAHIETHLAEFNRETTAAEFLFDADVVNYLQQIRERVEAEPQGAALWLSDPKRIPEMRETFVRYLGFQNVKA
jgi:hypothetical protein